MSPTAEAFDATGFVTVPAVLAARTCEAISRRVRPSSISGGTRTLLGKAWCAALVDRLRRHPGIAPVLPSDHVAVQCTYFEKSAARNWSVPAHQDLSVPVAGRVESPGLGGWSRKEGSLFVQAPDDLLRQLIAVRLHLEPCGDADGPLKLVPGSHRLGRLADHQVAAGRATAPDFTCIAAQGDALVMRPLLIHASPKASGGSRRRVLHVVFGPRDPGHGLRWQHAA